MKKLTYEQMEYNYIKAHGNHSPENVISVPVVLIKAIVDSINESIEWPEQPNIPPWTPMENKQGTVKMTVIAEKSTGKAYVKVDKDQTKH